jgi:uncharacterized protein (TIGR03435 family)
VSYLIKIVIVVTLLLKLAVITTAQNQPVAFEVATIKPTPPDWRGGRYTRMEGGHQFFASDYTLKYMVAAAYGVTLRTISGGPSWVDSDHYDIVAATPGDARPSSDDQMLMLQSLLADRFQLRFHMEQKDFSFYALTVEKSSARLKESPVAPDQQTALINVVFPGDFIRLPARNATMAQFAAILQRAVLDRPVLDKTGLTGKYDFDLEWTPDGSQFGGVMPPIKPDNSGKPNLFEALQQLGLKLESRRGPVPVIVVDHVERPSEN